MSDEEIELLKAALQKPGCTVMWVPDYTTALEVFGVGRIKDEPGPIAYYQNGKYGALWNCELSDFRETYPLKVKH